MSESSREMTVYEYIDRLPDCHKARREFMALRDAYWSLPNWLRWVVVKIVGKEIVDVLWCGEPPARGY